ncbi:MAG TPA: dephospho-CoA kinase [Candidatus Polarisedimenticolaceae bacterium]|nr:dephospho-CoA kinase [Candidatus Polarisedimenticolaceae bacterium]
MVRAGLTGGLASGKSTVAAMFRRLGALHLDADVIAHELLAPGGRAEAEVVARFGPGILGTDGAIDRGALGAIVFADPAALADLNAIVHPKVREEIARRLAREASSASPAEVALVDAPLLVEAGMHGELDAVVVVTCPPEVQVARAVARGMREEEARRRIAAQAPLAAKLAVADVVIDNGGTLDETEAQVREAWDRLRERV